MLPAFLIFANVKVNEVPAAHPEAEVQSVVILTVFREPSE